MLREEMIAEISVRCNVPMDVVDDVLEEQDVIIDEELCAKKRRKKKCMAGLFLGAIIGAVVALIILDKKEKIDIEESVKKYTEKYMDKLQAIKDDVISKKCCK